MIRRCPAVFATTVIAMAAWATPSTTYWTPCTMDFQSPDKTHITLDNYFTIADKEPGAGGEAFPTDVGLTWGWKVSEKLRAEGGLDWLEPSRYPLFLNCKIGFPEGALSPRAPAVELGLFSFGFKRGVTNQNVGHVIVGKMLREGAGRLHAGLYLGNAGVLRSSSGSKQNAGFMIGYDRVLVPDKVIVAADYASGRNALGGGGVGGYYYFTKDVSLLSGPVWFNDRGINGRMKWTTQLDVNF